MAKRQRKMLQRLAARQAVWLENVPDSERKGSTKPGSQNRKK